jgi:hypothetical protein
MTEKKCEGEIGKKESREEKVKKEKCQGKEELEEKERCERIRECKD